MIDVLVQFADTVAMELRALNTIQRKRAEEIACALCKLRACHSKCLMAKIQMILATSLDADKLCVVLRDCLCRAMNGLVRTMRLEEVGA